MNNYVVYKHLKPNGEVFYIGMGRPYRPYYKYNRTSFWNNIVKKYGYSVEIVKENLDLESAIKLEKFLIRFYGRKDLGLGNLCNMTDGGDRRSYTEEQKLQMSISNKGKKHIYKSKESLNKSEINRFKKGSEINNKKVINIETGEIYKSAKALAEILGKKPKYMQEVIRRQSKKYKNYKYMENKEVTTRNILIAVYGSLRKEFGNHGLIKDAEYKGMFSTDPVYSLYSLGGYPGLKENGNTSVVMEVYAVNEAEAHNVDMLEGYTPGEPAYFYDKVNLETPWGNAGLYIYVGTPSQNKLVKSGDWFTFKKGLEVREVKEVV